MSLRHIVLGCLLFVLGAGASLAATVSFPDIINEVRGFLNLEIADAKADDAKKHEEEEHIHLSPAARKSLGLVVDKVVVQDEYVRTLKVPGVVVERPGNCEQFVSTPLAGVIKQIHATPHDRVGPGDPLFTLQVVSEPLQTAQAGYYKTLRELEQVRDRQKRFNTPGLSEAISPATLIELEQRAGLLVASLDAFQQDLKVHGLSPKEIHDVGLGVFLDLITIRAPQPVPNHDAAHGMPVAGVEKHGHDEGFYFEMEALKTLVGDTVQAGQILCSLADHKTLFIEGRAFASEAVLVQKAAKEGLKVTAEIMGEGAQLVEQLQLSFFANRVDPDTQTLTFYVVLPNSFEKLTNGAKTYHLWRYRPGQRVTLHVPMQKLNKVFVVPATAVVREGPESFVFRPHGPDFERHGVHILHEDNREAVLAYDSEIAGRPIAMNGAIQLNWVLKAQRAGGGGGHSHDHGH